MELDASKTEQILGNLISNAIKFTPEGGTVRVEVGAAAGMVGFSVTDSGIGIPSEIGSRIFERGASLNRPGTRLEGGTGLGLWICRTFTELQGGTIHLGEKEEGTGARFDVRFPAHAQAAA